jgi:hypothetical protein
MNEWEKVLLNCVAVIPVVGVVGILALPLFRQWLSFHRFAQVLFLSGAAIAGALMFELMSRTGDIPEIVGTPLWTWFSLPVSRRLALKIGLEFTLLKAQLVLALGVLLCLRESIAAQPNDNSVVGRVLFFISTIVCIGSPNLPQALLGWSGLCIAAWLLFNSEAVGEMTTGTATTPRSNPSLISHVLSFSEAILMVGTILYDRTCETITTVVPQWISDQMELIDDSAESVRLLAGMLGCSVVLLTWIFTS